MLHLILSEEMDVFEVSISEIIERFVATVDGWRRDGEAVNLEVLTEFVLVAATLIELKARRLLPGRENIDLDEELMRFEERDLLLARLVDCKTFQDVSRFFEERFALTRRSVARQIGVEEPFASLSIDPLEGLAPTALAKAAARALTPRPEAMISIAHLSPIRYTVKDTAVRILEVLPEHESVSFRALISHVEDRIERIVYLLAVLELYKQGALELDQAERFGDLTIARRSQAFDLTVAAFDDWNERSDDGQEIIDDDSWDLDAELAAEPQGNESPVEFV